MNGETLINDYVGEGREVIRGSVKEVFVFQDGCSGGKKKTTRRKIFIYARDLSPRHHEAYR